MYGWGHNEGVLGGALRGLRDKVVLATKFGQTQNPGGPNGVNGRPDYVRSACEASLKRLGVEVIDLYYQHRVDPDVPIEDTVGAMADLVRAGQGPLPRPVARRTRTPSAAPMPSIPSPRCRPNTRCSTAQEAEETRAATARTRHRLRRLQPARARLPDRRDPESPRWTGGAPPIRGSSTRTSRTNRALVEKVEAIAGAKKAARLRSSASPGCWPRARTSWPSPARATGRAWRRTSAPSRSAQPAGRGRHRRRRPGRRRGGHPLSGGRNGLGPNARALPADRPPQALFMTSSTLAGAPCCLGHGVGCHADVGSPSCVQLVEVRTAGAWRPPSDFDHPRRGPPADFAAHSLHAKWRAACPHWATTAALPLPATRFQWLVPLTTSFILCTGHFCRSDPGRSNPEPGRRGRF